MPWWWQAVCVPDLLGNVGPMFVWSKRSGRRGRVRFYWWPLVLSLVVSVLLTIVLNAR